MTSHSRHLRTPSRRTRWLAFALSAAASLAAAPAASADVLSVDDDKVQCPSADYTTIQDAVAAAPQGSTIMICAGTYNVPAGTAANNRSQGLKIEKNLVIRGEGADKVFVQPANTFPTIASTTPNERDEWGNVITVKRRTVELVDVQISGLTVQGNGVSVEAGIAMIDVNSGSISGVRVRDLIPTGGTPGATPYTGPLAEHGHGIVVANTLQNQINNISVTGNAISGYNNSGIVVDGRNLAGTAPIGTTLNATVTGNRITGAGPGPSIGQNGIAVWGGPNATIRGNIITGNDDPTPTEDATTTAAVLLRGAGASTLIGASATATNGNNIAGNSYGVYNADFAGTIEDAADDVDASQNWWGANTGPTVGLPKGTGDPVSGNSSVVFSSWRTAAITLATATAAPANPAAVAPTIVLDDPPPGAEADGDVEIPLGAVAGDDFGVAKVEFKVDGAIVATDETFPYTGTWTTPEVATDTDVSITATVTDSGGLTTTSAARTFTVLAPEPDPDPDPDPDTDPDPGTGTPATPSGDGGGTTPPVTGAGATPPPAGPSGSSEPLLSSASVGKARPKKGKARIVVKMSEPGTATIKLTATVKGKTVTVGTATVKFTAAGRKTVYVKLSSQGKKLLKTRVSLKVTAKVKTKTAAGTRTVFKSLTLLG